MGISKPQRLPLKHRINASYSLCLLHLQRQKLLRQREIISQCASYFESCMIANRTIRWANLTAATGLLFWDIAVLPAYPQLNRIKHEWRAICKVRLVKRKLKRTASPPLVPVERPYIVQIKEHDELNVIVKRPDKLLERLRIFHTSTRASL